MAFESQKDKSSGRGRGDGTARITLKLNTSGSTGVWLTKPTGLQGQTVDIEIDEETKRLRVGIRESGFKVSDKGAFSLSKKTFRCLSPKSDVTQRIELTKGEDGWWYGSYAEGDSHG